MQVEREKDGHVEGKVGGIGQRNGQLAALLEQWNALVDDDGLKEKTERVEEHPGGVADPGDQANVDLVNVQHVVGVAQNLRQRIDEQEVKGGVVSLHLLLSVNEKKDEEGPSEELHSRKKGTARCVAQQGIDNFQYLHEVEELDCIPQ